MALLFVAASTQRVNVGAAATLDNMDVGTALMLAKPSSTADAQLWRKGAFYADPNRHGLYYGSNITLFRDRGTTDLNATAALVNFTNHTLDEWNWYAAVWDVAGANGDQKLYIGTLTAALAEPAAYATQIVGSGATVNNDADDMILGNSSDLDSGYPGSIARVIFYNTTLTLAQLKAIQFGGAIFPGRIGHWEFGFNGVGTQPDWSGNFNAGTVTGATQAAHAPSRILPFGRITAPAYNVTPPVVDAGFPMLAGGAVPWQ